MGYKLADGSDSEQYKIGDEFEVVCDKYHGFDVGEVIKLESLNSFDSPSFYGYCSDSDVYASQLVRWQEIKPHRKPFTKSDLKDGMRVITENGDTHYVCGKIWVDKENTQHHLASHDYDENLIERYKKGDYPIAKILDRDGTVVFEREPEKRKITLELTDDQIESLKQQGIID